MVLGVVGLSSVKWKWRLWWGSRGYGGVMREWVTSRGVTSHTGGPAKTWENAGFGFGASSSQQGGYAAEACFPLLSLACVCVCVCVCVRERERERRVCVCFSVWGRWVCVCLREKRGGGDGGGGRTWEKGGRDRGILTKVKLCLLILCDISRHATLINSAQLV